MRILSENYIQLWKKLEAAVKRTNQTCSHDNCCAHLNVLNAQPVRSTLSYWTAHGIRIGKINIVGLRLDIARIFIDILYIFASEQLLPQRISCYMEWDVYVTHATAVHSIESRHRFMCNHLATRQLCKIADIFAVLNATISTIGSREILTICRWLTRWMCRSWHWVSDSFDISALKISNQKIARIDKNGQFTENPK